MNNLRLLFITLLVSLTNLQAQEYNLHIPDFNDPRYCDNAICPDTGCEGVTQQILADIENRNNEIKVNYLDLTIDQETNRLIIEAEVDTTKDKVANLFHIVLTDGNFDPVVGPQACEGRVAHLYVDYTDEENPKLNVFAFNGHLNLYCNNGEIHNNQNFSHNGYDSTVPYGDGTGPYVNQPSHRNSFYRYPPTHIERIYTSNANSENSSFSIDNTGTSKIIRLELNTDVINNYEFEKNYLNNTVSVLLHNKSYQYEGINFSEKVGVWFWAAANADADYTDVPNKGEYISQLITQSTDCSTCTKPDHETKSRVLCGASSVTANPVEVGKSTTLSFEVINKDFSDADIADAQVLASYTGLPAGAKPNIPAGEEVVFSPFGEKDGKATVVIEWTPTADQVGDYVIGANFLVDYGLKNLYTECTGVKVTVTEITPECRLADLSIITQADQDLAQLNVLASQLEYRIKRVRSRIGASRNVDTFDADGENVRGWTAYNAIVGNGTYLFECTNVDSCADDLNVSSLDSELDVFKSAISNLRDIGLSRANKLRKALVKLYIQNGLEKAVARRKALRQVTRKYLQGNNNTGINPVFNSATSFVDLHVNTYGLTRFSADSIADLEQSCGLQVKR